MTEELSEIKWGETGDTSDTDEIIAIEEIGRILDISDKKAEYLLQEIRKLDAFEVIEFLEKMNITNKTERLRILAKLHYLLRQYVQDHLGHDEYSAFEKYFECGDFYEYYHSDLLGDIYGDDDEANKNDEVFDTVIENLYNSYRYGMYSSGFLRKPTFYNVYSEGALKRHKELLENRKKLKEFILKVVKMKDKECSKLFKISNYSWSISLQNIIITTLCPNYYNIVNDNEQKLMSWVLKMYAYGKLDYLDDLDNTSFIAVINFLMFQNVTDSILSETDITIDIVNVNFGINSNKFISKISNKDKDHFKIIQNTIKRVYEGYINVPNNRKYI